jgi:hypothetical protein
MSKYIKIMKLHASASLQLKKATFLKNISWTFMNFTNKDYPLPQPHILLLKNFIYKKSGYLQCTTSYYMPDGCFLVSD